MLLLLICNYFYLDFYVRHIIYFMCDTKGCDVLSSQRGRPKTDNPIERKLSIRLDENIYQKLLKYCKVHSISRAEAIRKGLYLLLVNTK